MNPQNRQVFLTLVGVLLLSILAALVVSAVLVSMRVGEPRAIPTIAVLPSLTPSDTPTPTLTFTPSATPTPTSTPTATFTPTATPTPTLTPTPYPPRLDDFWAGRAEWVIDVFNVGLPRGESDTLLRGDGVLWSFLHASARSAGVVDRCGVPVDFPGCVTLWTSVDGGRSFSLAWPVCLLPCLGCPCHEERDHVQQQQYPRVAAADDGTLYMVYEWGARTMLRISDDGGATWSRAEHVPGTGIWPLSERSCTSLERIDPHPYTTSEWDCLVGAPPGVYVEGDELYIFVDLGSNPAHMGCLRGNRHLGVDGLRRCETTPLFSGSLIYGPPEARGASANPYFDFRYLSSADVAREGSRYYMVYEGVRGPGPGDPGDTQFGLGFARSSGAAIDLPWEKYPNNPILWDLPGNIGLGHADLLRLGETWYLYTTTAAAVRGRYRLEWR